MSTKLSEIIPKEELTFFGLTLQRLNIDLDTGDPESNGSVFTLTLVQESGQVFELENINFTDGVAPLVNLKLGGLDIIGSVVSWEETAIDIGGHSIFTVQLAQYKNLFLDSFKVKEVSYVSQSEFINNTILVSGIIIGGITFGPSISEIFTLFKDKIFPIGSGQISFNFDELNLDSNSEPLIKLNKEETTLFDIVDDFAKENNFNYSLDFKLVNSITIISFIKNRNINELNPVSREFDNILDAIKNADNDKIISYKKGYAITKNFTQQYNTVPSQVDFLNQKIINVVYGGFQSDFLHFTKGDIKQFWGFDSDGNLLDRPKKFDKMTKILNNKDIFSEDTDLRQFMNIWGKQFVVNSTHLTEILPLTPEQQEAVAQEEQAMVDLIEAILAHFNSLPVRQLGDLYRNGETIFREFVNQYLIDNTDITDQAMFDFTIAMLDGPNDTVLLDPDSMVGIFDRELNSLSPNYPSIDEILIGVGKAEIYKFQGFVGLELKSVQISLEQARVNIIVPSGAEISSYCFPSGEHPLLSSPLAQTNFRESDGQWPSYIELPELPTSNGLTQYAWASKIISSINHINTRDKDYIKVNVKKYQQYYIITIPGQLLQITSTILENGTKIDLDVIELINDVFISTINTQKRYGPFIVLDGELLDEQSQEFKSALHDPKFRIKNIVDNSLVPERFSNNGALSKSASLLKMENFIIKNANNLHPAIQFIQSFGTLEVAGLPRKEAFDGTIFPDGSFIDRVSINIGTDGIKTIYYVKPNRKDIIKKEITKIAPTKDTPLEPSPKNEDPVVNDEPALPDSKEVGLTDKGMEYVYKKPEGGQGVIVDKEGTTPFYTVRRQNYADIDSQTFAGGINITNSYFLAEWTDARNMSEPEDSPGLLLPGTRVNVSIFSESEFGPFVASFDSPPPNSAPGTIFSADSIGPRYAITLDGGWNIPPLLDDVVNVQEPEGFGGSLLPGTKVSVQLFNNGSDFYISHAPQTFAPPKP